MCWCFEDAWCKSVTVLNTHFKKVLGIIIKALSKNHDYTTINILKCWRVREKVMGRIIKLSAFTGKEPSNLVAHV